MGLGTWTEQKQGKQTWRSDVMKYTWTQQSAGVCRYNRVFRGPPAEICEKLRMAGKLFQFCPNCPPLAASVRSGIGMHAELPAAACRGGAIHTLSHYGCRPACRRGLFRQEANQGWLDHVVRPAQTGPSPRQPALPCKGPPHALAERQWSRSRRTPRCRSGPCGGTWTAQKGASRKAALPRIRCSLRYHITYPTIILLVWLPLDSPRLRLAGPSGPSLEHKP